MILRTSIFIFVIYDSKFVCNILCVQRVYNKFVNFVCMGCAKSRLDNGINYIYPLSELRNVPQLKVKPLNFNFWCIFFIISLQNFHGLQHGYQSLKLNSKEPHYKTFPIKRGANEIERRSMMWPSFGTKMDCINNLLASRSFIISNRNAVHID